MEKRCEACNQAFICQPENIANCDCTTIRLSAEDHACLITEYKDCLCLSCLKKIKYLVEQKKDPQKKKH